VAKKRSGARARTQVSTRPLVKQIDAHIKTLKALKTKATPQQKKKADRHIGKLTRLKRLAMADCDGFILSID
jgi:hypothetical protein